MPTTKLASMFRKKYEAMGDGYEKKKKNLRFLPSFKKKSKAVSIVRDVPAEEPINNEDNLTVALSHLSSNPSSPTRSSDLMEDPKLWTSTFDEEEVQTNASSDMLLIFTSPSNDDAEDIMTPLQVLMEQPLSLTSFTDNGEDVVFRTSFPPPRKTIMPTSLATPVPEQPPSKSVTPLVTPKKEQTKPAVSTPKRQKKSSTAIDMDTNDQWHDYDDESQWVEFLDERQEHADWDWNAANIDWGTTAPMDEAAEVAFLTSESFEYLPKDTSDEASLDPSTTVPSSVSITPFQRTSPKMTLLQQTPTGEVEVCDPECPLRFFKEHEQEEDVDQEPPADTPGYPFVGDLEEEETKEEEQEVEDMFSLSFYQNQIAKFQSVESRGHMTKRLHRETLAIIGSVSEKLYTLEEKLYACDEPIRSRFQSRNKTLSESKQQEAKDEVSVATSNSTETRKKGNTSYFSTEHFRYPSDMFGKCNVIEPFLRFGQAEI